MVEDMERQDTIAQEQQLVVFELVEDVEDPVPAESPVYGIHDVSYK